MKILCQFPRSLKSSIGELRLSTTKEVTLILSSYFLPNVTYLSFQLKRGREIGRGVKNGEGEHKEEIGKRWKVKRKMKHDFCCFFSYN